jgi:hypothetical protein
MHLKLRRKRQQNPLHDAGRLSNIIATCSYIDTYHGAAQVGGEHKSWLLTCTSTLRTSMERPRLCTKKS